MQNKIKELEQSIATTAPTVSTGSNNAPNECITHKDSNGNKWFKRMHYCSKHGYNVSHSNQNCRDKHKAGGLPWIDGATAADNKGGSTRDVDKYQQWFNPSTKEHASVPP